MAYALKQERDTDKFQHRRGALQRRFFGGSFLEPPPPRVGAPHFISQRSKISKSGFEWANCHLNIAKPDKNTQEQKFLKWRRQKYPKTSRGKVGKEISTKGVVVKIDRMA